MLSIPGDVFRCHSETFRRCRVLGWCIYIYFFVWVWWTVSKLSFFVGCCTTKLFMSNPDLWTILGEGPHLADLDWNQGNCKPRVRCRRLYIFMSLLTIITSYIFNDLNDTTWIFGTIVRVGWTAWRALVPNNHDWQAFEIFFFTSSLTFWSRRRGCVVISYPKTKIPK